MPRVKDSEFTTFNDGILDICEVKERTIIRTKQKGVRFGKKTVGISRFWQAKVSSSTVDALISILPVPEISKQDICIINGRQYKILQIQDKFDQAPPYLLLSLERNPILYKDARHEN